MSFTKFLENNSREEFDAYDWSIYMIHLVE